MPFKFHHIMNKDINTEHGTKFEFNGNVSLCFDDMLTRSIPAYSLMRELVNRISQQYCINTTVVDIGTSLGDSIFNLCKKNKTSYFIGLDESDNMIEKAKIRFIDDKNVEIRKHNLKNEIHISEKCGLVMSILTIQFTPIEYRFKILKNIFNLLSNNGVFIFVEKIIGYDHEIDSLLTKIYYDFKRENGYSNEEIQRKKLSLEGVLVPMTSSWNEEMLRITGFKKVDCFWRCLNFSGWIAIK
jgi:tRNA (cmo5U34)-methyltransferase